MTDPTTSILLEVSTPALYRRNAFRITGLPTDADRRTVRQRQQRVNTMLEVGADLDLGHDLTVEPQDVARAFDLILGDPRRRLVDELFWLWDTADATCGCPTSVHQAHDAAVEAHSAALDRELLGRKLTAAELKGLEKRWDVAGRRWRHELRRAAFWNHVRHRIAALDDRQLDASAIDVLRDELPTILIRPLIQLAVTSAAAPRRLADQARAWPAPEGVVNDLLERAAEPLYEAIRTGLTQASGKLNTSGPEAAASLLTEHVMPTQRRLDVLVPARLHRRTASLRNEVGIMFNNCASRLVEDVGPDAEKSARGWLQSAKQLASDPQALQAIARNGEALTEIIATFDMIRERVREFVALGRPDLAREMLLDLRRKMADVPGAGELDRMLAELGPPGATRLQRMLAELEGRGPTYWEPGDQKYRPRPARPKARPAWGLRFARIYYELAEALPLLIILALVLGGIYWFFLTDEEPEPVSVFSAVMSQNAPAGTCVATREGWQNSGERVPAVPCDQEHWGEILGYVQLAAAPSPYPGGEAVQQAAGFECAWLQERHVPRNGDYTTQWIYPSQQRWNGGAKTGDNYATCLVRRVDGKPLPERNLVDPNRRPPSDLTVRRDMSSRILSANPPVGSCVTSRESYDEDRRNVSFSRCEQPHWGEILGYPVLYEPNQPWPGEHAVSDAADAACRKLATDVGLDTTYRHHVTWPAQAAWVDQPDQRRYAVCTVSRLDNQPLTGRLR